MCKGLRESYPDKGKTPDELLKEHFPNVIKLRAKRCVKKTKKWKTGRNLLEYHIRDGPEKILMKTKQAISLNL